MENNNRATENDAASVNYDLKSDAVEQLVHAGSGDAPTYSQEELQKYRTKSRLRIPQPVKILLIKAWFAGAVCFFILWGLGMYIAGMLDMLFILGVVLGLVTDLLTNPVIRFLETVPGENDAWMLFPKKGMLSFILNIVYSCLIIYCVYCLYTVINYTINAITGSQDTVPLGVEPILFGVFCVAFDMLFVGVKRVFSSILRDAKNAAAGPGRDETAN